MADETDNGFNTSSQPPTGSQDDKKNNKNLIVGIIIAVVVLLIGGLLAFFVVNNGKTTVPNLDKVSLAQAKTTLESDGLKVGTVSKKKQKGASNIVLSQTPTGGTKVDKGTAVDLVISETITGVAPNVVGLQLQLAQKKISISGFTVGTITYKNSPKPAGVVLSQNPIAKKTIDLGGNISLVVSSGSNTVPSVIGMTSEKAAAVLVSEGLAVRVSLLVTTTSPAGVVLKQTPAAGATAPDGTMVTITVAKAPTPPKPAPTPTPTATVTVVPQPTKEPTPTTIITVTP